MKTKLFGLAFIAWCLFLLNQTDAGQPNWLDVAVPATLIIGVLFAWYLLASNTEFVTPDVFESKK